HREGDADFQVVCAQVPQVQRHERQPGEICRERRANGQRENYRVARELAVLGKHKKKPWTRRPRHIPIALVLKPGICSKLRARLPRPASRPRQTAVCPARSAAAYWLLPEYGFPCAGCRDRTPPPHFPSW